MRRHTTKNKCYNSLSENVDRYGHHVPFVCIIWPANRAQHHPDVVVTQGCWYAYTPPPHLTHSNHKYTQAPVESSENI